LTIPNVVSLVRIALIPSITYFLCFSNCTFAGIEYKYIACALFILVALSDALDGYLARKLNQVTTLGKLLDPLADKLLVIAVLIVLIEKRLVPALPVMLIIMRDLTISLFRGLAASRHLIIAASPWGKIKTVLQVIAIAMLILSLPFAIEVLWVSITITLLTGAQIIWNNKEVLYERTT